MDILSHNRSAWDALVAKRSRWTVPVGPEVIAATRRGEWGVILTPTKAVPSEWFGPLAGRDVLALASGGGQQVPVLAAAGARVTSFELSPAQLAQDRLVAEREGLAITDELGDMRDLSRFADASFDLVFHPAANSFVPDVRPVWNEAFRVLRSGGRLMSGIVQPALYLFDDDDIERGEFVARYPLPYSDLDVRTPEQIEAMRVAGEPLAFGHTLEQQIGGQLAAGFRIIGFYEDRWPEHPVDRFIASLFATLAEKPA